MAHGRSDEIAAEAAAWLARLESQGRTPATEAGLRAWLGADADHRRIFERVVDSWAIIPGAAALLGQPAAANDDAPAGPGRRLRGRALGLAASLLLATFLIGGWYLQRPLAYATAIGEQKVATLADGSRVALNADTRLSIHYDDQGRSVELDEGEAMFEVVRDPDLPFRVVAGSRVVTALGTSFIVRRRGDMVVVTLLSGKVRVDKRNMPDPRAPAVATILAPGERLTAAPGAPELITQTSLEAATAWRRGQVVFDDSSLSAAVAEFNRYGGTPIDLADPRLGSLSISGVFATNDPAEFASAVAALHDLRVERRTDELRLIR